MPRKPALIDAIDQARDAQAFEFRVLAPQIPRGRTRSQTRPFSLEP